MVRMRSPVRIRVTAPRKQRVLSGSVVFFSPTFEPGTSLFLAIHVLPCYTAGIISPYGRKGIIMADNEKLTLEDADLEKVTGGMLTREEALAKALEHAELEKDQVEYVKKVELDYEHGKKVFEVEFFHNGFEYEYDIDAQTGRILKYERERD